jgi:hypothetical protein
MIVHHLPEGEPSPGYIVGRHGERTHDGKILPHIIHGKAVSPRRKQVVVQASLSRDLGFGRK